LNTTTNYQHTGLALFSHLPAGTRFIRLLSDASFPQRAEGISFDLAGRRCPSPHSGCCWRSAARR
jgi:hypothetical protein